MPSAKTSKSSTSAPDRDLNVLLGLISKVTVHFINVASTNTILSEHGIQTVYDKGKLMITGLVGGTEFSLRFTTGCRHIIGHVIHNREFDTGDKVRAATTFYIGKQSWFERVVTKEKVFTGGKDFPVYISDNELFDNLSYLLSRSHQYCIQLMERDV